MYKNLGKKFEDIFLVKIGNKGTSLIFSIEKVYCLSVIDQKIVQGKYPFMRKTAYGQRDLFSSVGKLKGITSV